VFKSWRVSIGVNIILNPAAPSSGPGIFFINGFDSSKARVQALEAVSPNLDGSMYESDYESGVESPPPTVLVKIEKICSCRPVLRCYFYYYKYSRVTEGGTKPSE
jgi:hypothetical protein